MNNCPERNVIVTRQPDRLHLRNRVASGRLFFFAARTSKRAALLVTMVVAVTCLTACRQQPQTTMEAAAEAAKLYKGPPVADFAVWRPYLQVGGLDIDSDQVLATAFALTIDGVKTPVVVTVLHPALRVDSPITDPELANASRDDVGRITISEAFGAGDEMRTVGGFLPPVEAAAAGDSAPIANDQTRSDLVNDLLFIDPAKFARRLRPLSFAKTLPKKGESVWMGTAVYGGASPSTVAHEAVLTECDSDGRWAYRFVNERLSMQATSGAPLLNSSGKVVGIHLTSDSAVDDVNGIGLAADVIKQQLNLLQPPAR